MKVGTIYIHYGSSVFDPALFKPIRNSEFIYNLAFDIASTATAATTDAGHMKNVEHNDEHSYIPSWTESLTPKPSGGLWASRVDDADMVYVPKRGLDIPSLVVELKWNENADTAIRQIKDKEYVNTVEGFGGDVLLVGISYDKDSGEYQCKIEKWVV